MWPTYRRRELWLLLGLAASLLVGLGADQVARSRPDWAERVERLEEPVQAEPDRARRPVPALRVPSSQNPLSLNQASAEELERVPGVGPVLAQRIIRYREEHGPFRDLSELRRVGGIGPKKYEAMRELVTVR